MPGSIQVSVLGFKELPSSSNFVKVSLGKVEYEVGDKGTFSFPLTNLRDNLIITIQDSEGNQVSNSGVRTMSIIEKGTWDDIFPIEGGGVIHMKLQFILSDMERNRIRSMREFAMKKKQDEILSSRLRNAEGANSLASSLLRDEVSGVLRSTSSQDFQRSSFNDDAAKADLLTSRDESSGKAAECSDGIKEESFQSQTFPNAADRREETSFSPMTEGMHQKVLEEDTKIQAPLTDLAKKNEAAKKPSSNLAAKLDHQTLEEKIPSDVKTTSEESISTPLQETEVSSKKNNEMQLQQADAPERLLEGVRQKALVEDTDTRELTDLVNKKKKEAEPKPLSNLAEKLDKQNLEEKVPSYVKKTSKESMPSPSSQETKVNTIKNNDVQLQQADVPKRLQEAASRDVGSTRSIIAEKIKSFSPKLAGEEEKEGAPERTPPSIRKMISVFESSISQDREPLKPASMKSYRVGTLHFLKDPAVKDCSEKSESNLDSLKNSEMSSSTRLRNSFSTGDLQKNLPSIIKTGEKVGFDKNFVGSTDTNMQSKGMVAGAGDKLISTNPKETKKLPKVSTTVASVGLNNKEKFALPETNTKGLPKSPEEGVNNEEEFALTESNTKELPGSPEEGVNNEDKFSLTETNKKVVPKSLQEDSAVSGRTLGDDEESNTKHIETPSNKIKDSIHAHGDTLMSFPGDCMVEEKSHQGNTISSIPESIVKDEVHCGRDGIMKQDKEMVRMPGSSSPKSSDEEGSTGSLGQAIKIALVVGFGVLVLLFRQREPGKGKKKENNPALKTQVFMNKRGSIEEQLRKIDVLKLS